MNNNDSPKGLWGNQFTRILLRILVLSVIFVSVFVGGTVALEGRFIFFPAKDLEGTPADLALDYQDAFFATSDGLRLHGWFVPGPKATTLLWLHGNAGNISHRLENIEMIHHRLGVSVFIFDYRGYGQSQGNPSEQGTYQDAQAALAYLRSKPEVIDDSVVLFGRSLGGGVAVDLATKEQVQGVILESAFTSIPSMAKRAYPLLPVGPFLRTRYDSLAKIGKISAPLLMIHSRDDEIVPYQEGMMLYEAASQPKRLYSISGASHNNTHIRGGEGYWQALEEFLDSLD